MSKDYIFIETDDITEHNEECNNLISQGYLPLGPTKTQIYGSYSYYQQTFISETLCARLVGLGNVTNNLTL